MHAGGIGTGGISRDRTVILCIILGNTGYKHSLDRIVLDRSGGLITVLAEYMYYAQYENCVHCTMYCGSKKD